MTLADGVCTMDNPCPLGYFRAIAEADCAACYDGCATCTGATAADCTSCNN